MLTSQRFFRVALLVSTALSLAMIGWRVSSYPQLLRLPGAWTLLLEAIGLLLLYVPAIVWATGVSAATEGGGGRWGAGLGVIAAVIQVAHLVVERFLNVPGRWNAVVTFCFMFGTFVVWGVAGCVVARTRDTQNG